MLKSDPNWSAIPADLPAPIRRLLRRCLEKEPRKRLSAIGDARLELDDNEPAAPARESPPRRAPASILDVAPVARGGGRRRSPRLAAWTAWPASRRRPICHWRASRFSRRPARSSIRTRRWSRSLLTARWSRSSSGSVSRSDTQLWVRSLDSPVARRLEAASGAHSAVLVARQPAHRVLHQQQAEDHRGHRRTRRDAVRRHGCARRRLEPVEYHRLRARCGRVRSSGFQRAAGRRRRPRRWTIERKEYGHRFPTFLPDGEHFLFAALPGKAGKFDIIAGSLADTSRTMIGSMDSAPVYADPGLAALRTAGGAGGAARSTRRAEDRSASRCRSSMNRPASWIRRHRSLRAIDLRRRRTGALAYFSAPSTNTIASWYDTAGALLGELALPPGHYETATDLSGRHAGGARQIDVAVGIGVVAVDLARGTRHRSRPGRGGTTRRSGHQTASESCSPPIVTARRISLSRRSVTRRRNSRFIDPRVRSGARPPGHLMANGSS